MATLPYSKDELSLSIKILNCRNLLIGDTVSSDPYVRILLGKKELHKTKYLMKTLNPVFTAKDNNEFETQFLWGDLTKKAGLTFEVKDWDLVGKDDFIGFVKISPSELLKMALKEEAISIPLELPPNIKKKGGAGSITMSIRHTSTTGVKSKYWAPPSASMVARRSTRVDPSDIPSSSSDDESMNSNGSLPDYNKDLFIEIISCKNLLAGDANGLSDPYVKVQMGKRFLHRTAVIKNTLNPAFTADHKNSFILDCPAKDLWAAKGIEFLVKDHDDGIAALGFTNDELGSAEVSAGKLYKANGTNMKINITPPKDSKEFRRGLPAGSITIRVRQATAEDKNEIRNRAGMFKKKATPRTEARKFIPEVDLTGIDKKILMVEILSCRELLAADKNGLSDPYVLVKMGFKDLHKTGHIDRTLNPTFSRDHRNSFVIDCSVSELFGANGVLIKVIDYDRGIISGDDELGSVQIPATTMYECQEEEYHLDPPPGRNEDPGYVTIRITEITKEQRDLHKKGKLSAPKQVMPAGLNTSESGLSVVSSGSYHSTSVIKFKDMHDKTLLVEILSCRDLIAADKNGLSDPYVRAKMGKKELHKTGCITKTLNPVFSSSQNNSFLITCSKLELSGAQGILIRVLDWDRGIGGDDDLGWTQVQAESLYECKEQEYPLNAPYGSGEAGFVTIRTTELSDEEQAKYKKSMLSLVSKAPPPPPPTSNYESNSSLNLTDMEEKIILVEIMSCRDLLGADKDGLSDPFVRIKMGSKNIHKTERVNKTLNPVYSAKENHSFVIDCSISELLEAKGILVRAVDWDRGFGGDDDLGWVQISPESLYQCNVQEYRLNPPYGKNEDAGYVTIRTTAISAAERDEHAKGILAFASKPAGPPVASATIESPSANAKGLLEGKGNLTSAEPEVYEPYDPDAAFIASEEQKFRMLLGAVVVSSILLVALTASGVTGRSARSGAAKLDMERVGERISRPREYEPIETRGGVCADLSGWQDAYGVDCEYYKEKEDACEKYATSIGSFGKTPLEACCVCKNDTDCFDLAGWTDFYEDTCGWYEENEPIGCPNEGHVNGTDSVNASQACCHCHGST
ncbi:unnamed protein product [Cylindrotheca closterium]|uniref:C2 domain-containing protein n=1 Tax=Cylindrotheca closterium TaxID=2856 RepID=A0AAD2G5W6_9STRA|nr:unnamed protein product [Cylindrotheca closterium]